MEAGAGEGSSLPWRLVSQSARLMLLKRASIGLRRPAQGSVGQSRMDRGLGVRVKTWSPRAGFPRT